MEFFGFVWALQNSISFVFQGQSLIAVLVSPGRLGTGLTTNSAGIPYASLLSKD